MSTSRAFGVVDQLLCSPGFIFGFHLGHRGLGAFRHGSLSHIFGKVDTVPTKNVLFSPCRGTVDGCKVLYLHLLISSKCVHITKHIWGRGVWCGGVSHPRSSSYPYLYPYSYLNK